MSAEQHFGSFRCVTVPRFLLSASNFKKTLICEYFECVFQRYTQDGSGELPSASEPEPGFYCKSVCVRYLVHKVALGQFFPQSLDFYLSLSLHQ